ncbi:MAG: SRPBCC domain-containing protein, partial [Verrucomicrobia bacterium]|nr:SRPBCC domain-containing protein [Verrucomicrobiota bacterium]
MREIVPLQKLVYSFKAVAAKVETLVTFGLEQVSNGTRLILTHSGWEGLAEQSVFEMFEQGWDSQFLDRLRR